MEPHGCAVSPQFGKALVDTTPVKDVFFVTDIVIDPFRFWFVLMAAVLGTA